LSFISFRRYYLDKELEKILPLFNGQVLDIGGKKDNRRGNFIPPYKQVEKWIFLNNDKSTNPDIVADLPIIPLEDNSIDVIICTEVIEYIYDYKKLLNEMNRVLKKDGILILSLPFLYTLHNDDKYDYFRFTESLIKKELVLNNFTIKEFNRMGGMFAVIFDLVRGYLSYQTKATFIVRGLRKIWINLNVIFKFLDRTCCKNNYYINTGYLIVSRKDTSNV
jgi:SAM-dependent methyltransferase